MFKTEEKMTDTKNIIKKWYDILEFPKNFDSEFYNVLEEYDIDSNATIENYDISSKDGKKNLLYFLYFCEKTKELYKEKNIPQSYLYETLYDIVTYTKLWSEVKGELHLEELYWLKRHLTLNIFKIGRLQFAFGQAEETNHNKGILKGENILEIHIPENEPFDKERCITSISSAIEFFEKYFPMYEYNFFTCDSWLLGDFTERILKPESNILNFAGLFDILSYKKSDSVLMYVFKWNTTRQNIDEFDCSSSIAVKLKEMVKENKPLTEGYGIIRKSDIMPI